MSWLRPGLDEGGGLGHGSRSVGRIGWPRAGVEGMRLEVLEIIDGLRGLSRRREYRPVVVLQKRDPVRQVLRVVGTHRLGDAKLRAKNGRAYLGDQLFRRRFSLAETLGEVAIEARAMADPMNVLVLGHARIASFVSLLGDENQDSVGGGSLLPCCDGRERSERSLQRGVAPD